MAKKKRNELQSLVAHLAMGIGGGLTGQNYLGNFQKIEFEKWKEENDPRVKAQRNMARMNELKLKKELDIPFTEEDNAYLTSQMGTPAGAPDGQVMPGTVSGAVPIRPTMGPQGIGESPSIYLGGAQWEPTKVEEGLRGNMKVKEWGKSSRLQAGEAVSKAVSTQEAKEAAKAGRDYMRVSSTTDTNLNAQFAFADEQFKLTGTKPGDFLGLISQLTPPQINQFKEAFESSSKEASATIARALIPNMRAIQGAKMFKQSTANVGATTEASISNVVTTMGNVFGSALSQNAEGILNTATDPKTGKLLSQLPAISTKGERTRTQAINDLKREFTKRLELQYYFSSYQTNPNILSRKGIARMKELIPKKQKFSSMREAEKANLPVGAVFMVGNKMGINEEE